MENRLGDNAEMAMIELVDYNTVYGADNAQTAKKTTRRRGGSAKAKAGPFCFDCIFLLSALSFRPEGEIF
jgi:hypothetical protein